MIDYTREGAKTPVIEINAPEEASTPIALKRKGSRRSARKEHAYGDNDEGDLEKEAQANHEEPLGTFMGDGRVKGREGEEDGYIAANSAMNPFATAAAPRSGRRSANSRREEEPESEDEGDMGMQEKSSRGHSDRDNYGRSSRPAPTSTAAHNPSEQNFLSPHNVPVYPTPTFVRMCILTGFQIGSFLLTLMSFNLLVVVGIGAHLGRKMNPFAKDPPRAKCSAEWEQRISGERFSSRAEYYAQYWGYECEDVDVETEDGFVLRLHHLTSKKHKALGHPVILQHGILSNSVTYMVNEERSLAFWLMEQGYDVYLSNMRTNFKMPHRHYKRSDPRYWAWSVKELGLYDLPAVIDYVHMRTGVKPAYIGHSQGAGTMFLALSKGMRPDLGNKISCFIALGPAVYAGPVLRSFPFSLMRKFRARWLWSLIFGVREFIPIISILQHLLPSWFFGHVGFCVFAFIFGFHDHNWLNRQIPKYFRGIAVATSSELLYYYMNTLSYANCMFDTRVTEPWFTPSFPPLAIFYGTLDYLVLGRPLVERIRSNEPDVKLVKAVALENYEHLDMLLGVNAVEDCYLAIREVIEQTRP
ncbi:hypothetical protein RQP46_006826 [Phenoliferia psychrophenolica]